MAEKKETGPPGAETEKTKEKKADEPPMNSKPASEAETLKNALDYMEIEPDNVFAHRIYPDEKIVIVTRDGKKHTLTWME